MTKTLKLFLNQQDDSAALWVCYDIPKIPLFQILFSILNKYLHVWNVQ